MFSLRNKIIFDLFSIPLLSGDLLTAIFRKLIVLFHGSSFFHPFLIGINL